jgi:hypothetical protein
VCVIVSAGATQHVCQLLIGLGAHWSSDVRRHVNSLLTSAVSSTHGLVAHLTQALTAVMNSGQALGAHALAVVSHPGISRSGPM